MVLLGGEISVMEVIKTNLIGPYIVLVNTATQYDWHDIWKWWRTYWEIYGGAKDADAFLILPHFD